MEAIYENNIYNYTPVSMKTLQTWLIPRRGAAMEVWMLEKKSDSGFTEVLTGFNKRHVWRGKSNKWNKQMVQVPSTSAWY